MASSGKATRSAPSRSARPSDPRILSTFPSMSPTTVSIWHRATRTRVTRESYRRRRARPAGQAAWHAATVRSVLPPALSGAAERSAAPEVVSIALRRILEERPSTEDLLVEADEVTPVALALIAVVAASNALGRLCTTDPSALDVLAS